MSFSKVFGVVLLASVIGCKKAEPEKAVDRPAVARTTGPAPVLAPVNFESGSTTIAAKDRAVIDEAASVLRSTTWTVLVLGLADASGDAAMNKRLSEERADAVAAELRSRVPKLKPERIVVHAIGERLAVGTSQSERKVEFVFFQDEGLPLREVALRSGVLESDFREKRGERAETPAYQPK